MTLIEIFKAGKRTDANGVELDITTEQLQQTVESYDPHFHEAPLVVGHPKMNAPAYGWVKALHLDGDVLKAEPHQVDPTFAEWVRSGRYKKISASFYLPDSPNNPNKGVLSLRHVGFLGAMPPAVKGLREPIFHETDADGIIEFQECLEHPENLSLTTTPPTYEENAMDKDQQIADLQAKLAQAESDKAKAESDKAKAEADKAKAEQAQQTAESENAQLKADKEAAEQAKAEAELDAVKAENANFAESLVAEGKLAPVAKDAAIALLNCSATTAMGGVVEFNEGESMLTLTKQFLQAQPQVVEFGEVASKERATETEADDVNYAETDDPSRVELDRKARAYMKKHNVDYAQAITAVL